MASLGTAKDARNLDVGAGEFSFCNFDKDVNPHQTFFTLGNCSEATVSWEVNTIDKRDATRGTREKIASVETQRDVTLNITMDESDPLKYALAMYGKTAIQEIEEQSIAASYTVSPGEEIFINIPDTETPAYNYKNLQIRLSSGKAATFVVKPDGGSAPNCFMATNPMASNDYFVVSGAFTGSADADYYVRITKANAVQGTITDVEYEWRKGLTGIWSAPVTATGSAILMADGLSITIQPDTGTITGTEFDATEVFKIECDAAMTFLKEGRDYISDEVDVMNGKVRIPLTADLDEDSLIVVECDVEAQKVPRIYAGIFKKIEGIMRFEYDPTWGREKAMLFYHVQIAPNGDDSLISDDWGSRQITCNVLASSDHADPENPMSRYFRVDYPNGSDDVIRGK